MSLFVSHSGGVWARAMRERNFAAILDWFTTYFIGSGVAILLVADFVAGFSSTHALGAVAKVASVGLLLAAASVVAGWLLGLLFGIPRSLSRPQPAPPEPASGADPSLLARNGQGRTSRTNTNLEDVSDWLTKTIVGLGLVNLYDIPGYVWQKAGLIGAQLFPDDASAQSFALLVAVYFAIGGFWIGYVGTRTMVTLLFDGIDQGVDSKVVAQAVDPGNLQLDTDTQSIKPATDGLLNADTQLLSRPLKAMNTATELAAWAAAKARSGDLDTALWILKEAMRDAPENPNIKKLLSIVSVAKKDSS